MIHSPDAVIHSPAEIVAACPRPQNAEAVFGVVEGDPLDEAGEHFLGQ